jgi:Xaa-Pro aminopeptidase
MPATEFSEYLLDWNTRTTLFLTLSRRSPNQLSEKPMVPPPFAKVEYRDRLTRLRATMSASGMDILIINDIANQHYLTAYDGWSFYTPQVVVVTLDDGDPFWIGRAMDAAGGRLTVWFEQTNVVGYPENYVQQSGIHPLDWIGEWIQAKGWGALRIGVELEAYFYSARAHAQLVAALPNAKIVDASLMVNWVRARKSPAEIAYLRDAARIAEDAMRVAYETIEPGVRECDAVAKIYAAQIAGRSGLAGDLTALPPTILGGANSSAPHIMWSDRLFGANETVALELAGAKRRYTAGLARTMQLGAPPQSLVETAKAVLEGMSAVVDFIRPGVTGEAVEAAWRNVIERYGLKKESRIGYAIGLGYPPDWGEHTISLRAGDKNILAQSHTLHCILGMWMESWGMEISETLLVTDRGCECLTRFPREVFVK